MVKYGVFLEIMMNSRNWKGTFADFAGNPPGFFLWISPRFSLLANQVDPSSGIVSNSLQLYRNGKLELWNWVCECLPPLFFFKIMFSYRCWNRPSNSHRVWQKQPIFCGKLIVQRWNLGTSGFWGVNLELWTKLHQATISIHITRSILDVYFHPLVFWYQWEYPLTSKKCRVSKIGNDHRAGQVITTSLRPHHRWWLVTGIIPKWPQDSGLWNIDKYSNLPK